MLAVGIVSLIISVFSLVPLFNTLPEQIDNLTKIQTEYGALSDEYQEASLDMQTEMMDSMGSMMAVSSVFSIVQLGVTIVFAIFANYWYKQHAIKKIKEVKEKNGSNLAFLTHAGGTRSAIWVTLMILTIVIYIVLIFSLFAVIVGAAMNSVGQELNSLPDAFFFLINK